MKYFIDANIIIHFYDYGYDFKESEKRNERKDKKDHFLKAKNKLLPILRDDESEIFINRLIYVESLRMVSDNAKFKYLKSVLENFAFVEIYPEFYEKAIALSRYCMSKGITIKGRCAAIDFIHFITAKHYNLEILANDNDMKILENIWNDFINS